MAVEFDPNEYFTQPGQVPAQPAHAPAPQYQPQPQPAYPPVQQPVQPPVPQAAPQPYAPPQNPYPAAPPAPQAAPPIPQYQPQPAPAPQHPPAPQYQPQHQAQPQHQMPQQFQYQAPQAQPYQPGVSPVQGNVVEEEAPKKGLLGRLKSKKPKASRAKPAKVKREKAPREGGGSSGFLKPYLLGLLTGAILTFGGLMLLGGPAPQKAQPAFEPVAQIQPPVTTQQVVEVIERPVETDPK